ncbi:MAG: BrnT family toxin [Bacteroidetes bacterium]|nr:MAG: BrnT family toxin [Bacteroidota bacterium]
MLMFEFDEQKSKTNKDKHGIDFKEAQVLWDEDNRIMIPAKNLDEVRFLLIAKKDDKHWSAIFTIRNKKVRIISVRRSRPKEIRIYENG